MTMLDIGNSVWMYLLGILVTVYVIGVCVFYIIRSYKDAKKYNIPTSTLRKTIINSAVFTILPSISILIGVLALSGTLGIPLPWIRLSVIGALHYEGTAAGEALKYLPIDANAQVQMVTVATVMTLGILSGPLFCFFGFKAYDKKLLAKVNGSKQENVEKVKEETSEVKEEKVEIKTKPKKNFGDLLFNAVFIAMVCCLMMWDIVSPFIGKAKTENQPYLIDQPYIPLIVVGVSFGVMALCDLLEKKCKWKWLSNFSLGLSMIAGMATAAIVGLF